MPFTPPTAEQLFALRHSAGIEALAAHPRFAEATPDLVEAIVDGLGQFAAGEFAPLNGIGDRQGARLENGVVRLPDGFAQAYAAYVDAGWNTLSAPPEHGGQGLPFTLAAVALETLGSANMAFTLCPMLSVGAVEALVHHGSAEQQARYLPQLVSGRWTGTMNLTEPQAGSDVGALRTMATQIADGSDAGLWSIVGTKIYITFGEHELAENIIHLVLARTPGAPAGTRGISLFLVPKYRLDAEGGVGSRNDLRCVSIEHKLGIHASPTCVMSFGDNGACVGELVGEVGGGMRAMFTMMNNARINVGSQGVQIAEGASQAAFAYARDRVQSARAGSDSRTPVPIGEHPDVRRMLMRMRGLTQGCRALLYYTCGLVDRGTIGDATAKARADLLVPMLKAWGTDVGVEVASLAIQVHGGMGFIDETGVAQYYRDARIAPIYEGTNGIQAADLVGRKLADGGAAARALLTDVLTESWTENADELLALGADVARALDHMVAAGTEDRLAGSYPFLTMFAVLVAGWQLLRQGEAAGAMLAAGDGDAEFLRAKQAVARFFVQRIVPEARGLLAGATGGAELLAMPGATTG